MQINTRMDVDEYFIKMARLVSYRGSCIRRQVGCVLVNSLNHVIATGYNGRARGVTNCLDSPCKGSRSSSGLDLEGCEAIHAEANALLQCKNVEEIKTAYCTTAPCIHCVKLLSNTSCERIVFQDTYPHMEESSRLWLSSKREWDHYPEQFEIYDSLVKGCISHLWALDEATNDRNDTQILRCVKCNTTKEVGK